MSEVSVGTYIGFSNRNAVPALVCGNEEAHARYPSLSSAARTYPFPVLDDILMAPANQSLDDKLEWVLNKLGSLRPGFYEWIVHPSDHGEGCSDVWLLTHPQVKRLLRRRRFTLTNWSEVWQRYLNG
jgi:hypothetical protein